MPRGDRTGPNGEGSQTGRAAGYCSGNSVPGFMSSGSGAGRGLGGGRGMAMRRGYGSGGGRIGRFIPGGNLGSGRGTDRFRRYFGAGRFQDEGAGYSADDLRQNEEQALKAEADLLKKDLDSIKTRLKSLRSEKE